jgi:uncharacterized protein (TIRG00374 family)
MKIANLKNKIIISIITVFILITFISIFFDFKDLLSILGTFDLKYIGIILLLPLVNYILRFIKWNYYLSLIHIKIPFTKNLLIFLSSFSLTITPGKLGEILKSYMLKEQFSIPISKSSPIVFAERVTDAISMLFLCALGLLTFNYGIQPLILITSLILIGIIFIQNKKLSLKLISQLSKLKLLKNKSASLERFYLSSYSLFQLKPLILSVIIGIFSWGSEALVIYFVIKALGLNILMTQGIFVFAFSSLVGALSMLPGGLIATEGSMIGLLTMIGISSNISASGTLIIRFATLWFGFFIGLIFLSLSKKNKLL